MDEHDLVTFNIMEWVYTILFTIDFVLQFFVEYKYPSSTVVETDLKKLCFIYLRGRFLFDFLSIIPLYKMLNWYDVTDMSKSKLAYLIKISRLYNGFSLLDYKIYMK